MNFIDSKDLTYEYIIRDEENNPDGEKVAVDGIDISIEEGDFVTILGKNGSGKSTLARLLIGILNPSGGVLYVDGKDLADPENIYPVREKVGMVFQNPDNQFVANVVEEDVAFGLENMCLDPYEMRLRVDEALGSVGMESLGKDIISNLSGGQKQRAAIAGILAMRPKCVVLDEATSMLDPRARDEVMETAKKLHGEGTGIINITHFMGEVIYSDHVYVMGDGKIVKSGTPSEIFAEGDALYGWGLSRTPSAEIADYLRALGMGVPDIMTSEGLVDFLIG